MTELRSTGCGAFGHPEFTFVMRRELPQPGLAARIVDFFERAVAKGTRFSVGDTVQYGWSTLRVMQRADGTLGVLEPDLRHELKWIESVDQAVFEHWKQTEVLESLGLAERADFPRQALQAVVCSRVYDVDAWICGRTEPSAQTDSGWFVGCSDDAHDHQSADALTVAPLVELAVHLPPLTAFFALPAGVDVVLEGNGPTRVRVFLDGEERAPREGSYLAALNRAD